MKILHYINNLGAGGAEKLLTDLLPEMQRRGHDIIIVYANAQNNIGRFEQIINNSNIQIYNINHSLYNPVQILKILDILKVEKPDIVHSHLFPTQYWLSFAKTFAKKNIKFIKTEHNVTNSRRSNRLFRPIEKFIYSQYDGIIAITQEVGAKLSDWLESPKNIEVIENGVNLNQIAAAKQLTLHLHFNPNDFNILMVGSFSNNQKDQETLIDSLEYLPLNVHIFFAGGGSKLELLKSKVLSMGKTQQVHFLGIRDDVYTLMHHVDLNVLSTNYEGLSGVALESMASGKPFIGSDVPGVNNIVPSTEFLFPAKNPAALASKIKEIITNEKLQDLLVTNGEKHVQNYDILSMVFNYLNYYIRMRDRDSK